MIVWKSTYDKLELKHLRLQAEHDALTIHYNSLQKKWNALVTRINEKGGESFLSGGPTPKLLTDKDIKAIIKLCHPDKHGGSELSKELTMKLLQMRT